MGTKYLKYWDADAIARKMSEKAFEHLTKPLADKINYIASLAYEQYLAKVGVTEKQAIELLGSASAAVITLDDGKGNDIRITYTCEDVASFSCYHSHVIENSGLYDQYQEVLAVLKPYESQKFELLAEIRKQIEGKSISAVTKNWPEAAYFINELGYGVPKNAMTTPLESLLARFLPALPAPEATA